MNAYFNNKIFCQKTHGNQFTGSGVADIIGHVDGLFFGLECKIRKPGYNGQVKEEQYRWMKKQIDRGGAGFWVIYDTEEQCTYWIPGEQRVSYRDRKHWFRTGWVKKTFTNSVGLEQTLYIIDCVPLAMLEMKRSSK